VPDIDVTDVLLDPDVSADTFTVIRRVEVINAYGEPGVTQTVIPNVRGAVYPTGDNSVAREAAFAAQKKSIEVVTPFKLRGVSSETVGAPPVTTKYLADIIVWAGSQFQIDNLDDFSRYGAGMTVAQASSGNFVDPAPGTA
jgi:hypothetical protein